MTSVTNPRTGVPIGTVTINGQPYNVTTHPEFMRFFDSLLKRVGGVTGASAADVLDEFYIRTPSDNRSHEAMQQVEELRGLLDSLRTDNTRLRSRIEELEGRFT